jgi:hypothetical protein
MITINIHKKQMIDKINNDINYYNKIDFLSTHDITITNNNITNKDNDISNTIQNIVLLLNKLKQQINS